MAVPQFMIDDYMQSVDPEYERVDKNHAARVQPKRGEAIFEGTDYPHGWDGFIGQAGAKEQLTVQVASAKARNTRIEHTLLASGSHGIGKSHLATLLAYQAGAGLIRVSGAINVDKARQVIKSMQDGDVLFWDELHLAVSGSKAKAEWLLPLMTEGRLYTDEGAIECPNIAIVGATTDVGRLPQTIISRFMSRPKLVPYTEDEAAQIVRNLASRMDVIVAYDTLPRIALAANGNPRDIRSILTAVRDLQLAFPDQPVDLAKAFDWAGFSHDGLSQVARDMLIVLNAQKAHTASIESLQALLGEPGPLKHHEQALLQRGLITITGRGRQLTDTGARRAQQLIREEVR